MDALVFDTSAVLNFGQRDDLRDVLQRLGTERRLLTTPDVVAELTDPEKRAFNEELLRENFEIQAPKTDVFELATLRKLVEAIHQGEISVMLLAKEHNATAVIDERLARKEARKLGVKLTGTLGLIGEGVKSGWLSEDAGLEKLRVLKRNGFRIPMPGANQTLSEYLSTVE